MRHNFFALAVIALATGCEEPGDFAEADGLEFRQVVAVDISAPAPDAPVVATLVAGDPFKFADRYVYAKAPGVGPTMSRFAPASIDSVPLVRSGDVVAVTRAGQTSRARIIGVSDGQLLFQPQQGSPFTHAFQAVPWAAWQQNAGAVQACSAAVANELLPCLEASGNQGACANAGAKELGECASGQDFGISVGLGLPFDGKFECLLPYPHYATALGMPMSMGLCSGRFWGTYTQESTSTGCVNVYTGEWVADSDCGFETVVLDRQGP